MGDLERAFGKADGAAALADAFVIVQHHHRLATPAEIKGSCETDRSASDDYHRMADRFRRVLIAAACVRVELEGQRISIGQRRRRHPCSSAHISRSRAAVQMRGVSMPRASS